MGLRVLASALPLNLGHKPCRAQGLVWLLGPRKVGAGLQGGRQTRPNLTLPLRGAFLGKSLELLAVSVVNPRPGPGTAARHAGSFSKDPSLQGQSLRTCGLPQWGLGPQLHPAVRCTGCLPLTPGAGNLGGAGGGQHGTRGPGSGSVVPKPGLRASGKAS